MSDLGRYTIKGMQDVRITPSDGGGHRLYIDGNEILHVKSICLEMGVDQLTTMSITMMPGQVDIHVQGDEQ